MKNKSKFKPEDSKVDFIDERYKGGKLLAGIK